ncbi:unnamed protein product [Didymodactylos carnosus]|uniref:Uncharacterized protein n=1 Tax=Didymodactylos carnosus TaxID=1234261 RepID=A0A813WM95_9BILA|nr:unnamed protein product [Didymodactylos carnosus]CAF1211591.1 unnamed protein product [Didymodactylos carnosus]CAF3647700.1 unnamed protein product [Didymodactylos carnosus]CAF4020470.1 unnamed protein product [Didymodactylos carnosus]
MMMGGGMMGGGMMGGGMMGSGMMGSGMMGGGMMGGGMIDPSMMYGGGQVLQPLGFNGRNDKKHTQLSVHVDKGDPHSSGGFSSSMGDNIAGGMEDMSGDMDDTDMGSITDMLHKKRSMSKQRRSNSNLKSNNGESASDVKRSDDENDEKELREDMRSHSANSNNRHRRDADSVIVLHDQQPDSLATEMQQANFKSEGTQHEHEQPANTAAFKDQHNDAINDIVNAQRRRREFENDLSNEPSDESKTIYAAHVDDPDGVHNKQRVETSFRRHSPFSPFHTTWIPYNYANMPTWFMRPNPWNHRREVIRFYHLLETPHGVKINRLNKDYYRPGKRHLKDQQKKRRNDDD